MVSFPCPIHLLSLLMQGWWWGERAKCGNSAPEKVALKSMGDLSLPKGLRSQGGAVRLVPLLLEWGLQSWKFVGPVAKHLPTFLTDDSGPLCSQKAGHDSGGGVDDEKDAADTGLLRNLRVS